MRKDNKKGKKRVNFNVLYCGKREKYHLHEGGEKYGLGKNMVFGPIYYP
jgi:hypothetical protein